MPTTTSKSVNELTLDLSNFRMPEQSSEAAALKAMIGSDPEPFWALMSSLLDSGFLPTENIVVLKRNGDLVVKEGNRRIAAIKLTLGQLRSSGIAVPQGVQQKIDTLTKDRKSSLASVPCAIFEASEADTVDTIVSLTHGKGERAGRTPWNAVATARHNRDHSGGLEPGLDLLESYLKHGRDLTLEEKAQWGGDYALSLLDEAIQKLSKRLGFDKATAFVAEYPAKLKAAQRKSLESLLHDIGTKHLTFPRLRNESRDVLADYGFPSLATSTTTALTVGVSGVGTNHGKAAPGPAGSLPAGASGKAKKASVIKPKAISANDPRSVIKKLREMHIRGKGREKIQVLRDEAVSLDIAKTPLAFCFVLRSMFELSGKAFCKDHAAAGLTTLKPDGSDRKLVDVLKDVVKHLISNAAPADQKELTKVLHGATAELAASDRFLSVTSMNQLVHSPSFKVAPNDICVLFHNVFPLLESMNA